MSWFESFAPTSKAIWGGSGPLGDTALPVEVGHKVWISEDYSTTSAFLCLLASHPENTFSKISLLPHPVSPTVVGGQVGAPETMTQDKSSLSQIVSPRVLLCV